MKVKFIDVGRNNNSWTDEYNGPIEDLGEWIANQAKRVLVSDNIWVLANDSDDVSSGSIHAGTYTVGEFEIVNDQKDNNNE